VLLLFNTTRAHSPDPQARGPLSLWTEVWPTHRKEQRAAASASSMRTCARFGSSVC